MGNPMVSQIWSLAKVLGLSAVGAAVIKYGLPYGLGIEAIAPSQTIAGVTVLLPSVVMACLLGWRSGQGPDPQG
jgi:hypothetical protein